MRFLREKMKYDSGLTADEMPRLLEATDKMEGPAREYAIKCFDEPELKTVEECEALCAALSQEEYDQLMELLTMLMYPTLDAPVDISALNLASTYNIPLAEGLTLENMTAQPAAALEQARKKEGALISEMIGSGG